MLRAALRLCLLFALASPVAAQSTWFVDPVNGSNANTGASSGDAFLSITFALANPALASGDTIVLNGGVYNDANGVDGAGNQAETWPLSVPNGVSLVAGSVFSPPELDGASTGGNAAVLVEIGASLAAITEFRGLTLENALTCFRVPTGFAVRGLVLNGCTLRSYNNFGLDMDLQSGRVDDSFSVSGCTFTGSAGSSAGFRLTIASNTRLDGGTFADSTVSGSSNGILMQTGLSGQIDADFVIARNTISNFQNAGILLTAATGDCTNSATVRGNIVLGDGSAASAESGISIVVGDSGGVGACIVDSLVSYNDFSRCDINVRLESQGLVSGRARCEPVFAGNLIRNASEYGVRMLVSSQNSNMSPDFGGMVGGAANAGRNTFENAGATFEVGLDPEGEILGPIAMAENFWLDGVNPVSRTDLNGQAVNYPTFNPILSNDLVGSLTQAVISPNQAETLTIQLTSGRFVVQVEETFAPDLAAAAGTYGQYQSFTVIGEGQTIDITPADFQLVAVDGSEISFNVPGLASGNYTIGFTNPGFQSLISIGLRVSGGSGSGGGGGGGGGCVVATAAHGDYHAPEVRILREFRDRYLIPYSGGRSAVRSYYKNGEPVALWIAEREWARDATRAALAVPTGLAWTLLNWNEGQRLLAAVLLLGASFGLLRRRS